MIVNIVVNFGWIWFVKVLKLLLVRVIVMIVSKDKLTFVIINFVMEIYIFFLEERLRRGGKIILLVLKKIVKSNKLIESICVGFKVVCI